MRLGPALLALLLLLAQPPPQLHAGEPRDWQQRGTNPLRGLPALPTTHHSYGDCQVGSGPAPSVPCPFPVDANSELQLDYARITHAWSVEIALGGNCCPGGMARDDDGNSLWDLEVLAKSLNKTEIVEATKLCAKSNASVSVNYSPWAYFWGGQLGLNANRTGAANATMKDRECPPATPYACDPAVEGLDEELEMRFFSTQLETISRWINETNAQLGSSVQIGGVLLDSERFLINTANATQVTALARKDELVYNVSRRFCHPPLCTVEQYNRGTITREATLAKPDEGIPPDDAWTPWPGTSAPTPTSPYGPGTNTSAGPYDTWGTSLYTIPEIGYTRSEFTQTVAGANKWGVKFVTPWLWLGGGCRRKVNKGSPGTTGCDPLWDYDLAYSWMIGREIADPFYGKHPARFAPWHAARRVALFPHPFSALGWTDPKHINASTGGISNNESSVLTSIGLKHFVAYVLGAANIRTLNNTNATTMLKNDDDTTKRWSDSPPAIPGMQLWKQRVRQGHHGYRAESLGDADFFLALLIGVPGPRPALLAFTEVRKFTDTDWDAKGIGMRASYDGGRTFTTSVEIVTDPPQAANLTREWTDGPFHGEGWDGLSLGTVTYDNHTGEIMVHYTLCANPCIQFGCVRPKSCGPDYTSRTMIVASNDSFSTWSAPVEVSTQLASGKKPIKTFFPGSGEGTQTASGRLIICGYTIDCAPAQGQSRNCTDPQHCTDNCQSSVLILSDTHGKTWRAGARVTDYSALPTNECDAVVLRNGSVLVSMRSYGTSRMQARSDDAGESFVASSIRHVPDLPSPGCQSSLISDADGTLFLSHPCNPSTRENMSVSVSRDDGNSWSVLTNVWPGPSGYGSLAVVPAAFGGPASIALAYNRGSAGDGCFGTACPYSTVVSFAVIPTGEASTPTIKATNALSSPGVATEQASRSRSEGELPLMSLGWWCSSASRPDSPGIFDNHERIVTEAAARSCTSASDCVAANNISRLLFEPRRCLNDTDALCPQPLLNGSTLRSVSDIVLFGRERWGTDKFIIAERLRSAWSAVIADASCYAKQQLNRSRTSRCGDVMKAYSNSLCQALSQAKLNEWVLDGEDVYAKELLDEYAGQGTAQALRYIKSTCAIEHDLSLTIGWTLHGDSGMQSYLFQNYSTYVGSLAESRVVDLVDWLLPRTWGDPLRGKYFSFSAAAHPGECSPGRDQAVMEWLANGREEYRIPASKLLVGVGSTHTSYRCGNSAYPSEAQPCDVPVSCIDSNWTPSNGDGVGGSQQDIYEEVAAGHMTMRYDQWAQQSYFVSNQTCHDCLTYVDSNTAQAFDFSLRQLKWRGVRGFHTQCVDDDYTVTSAGVGRHWAQDTVVHQHFQQASEVFAVSTGASSAAAGGLDISSGDSICRMFGGRIETLGDPVVPARCTVPPCVVNCFGTRPASAASAWPFAVLPWNESHWSQLRADSSSQQQSSELGRSSDASVLFQITTKSMSKLSDSQDPERLATDPFYRREIPFTSDAGRIIAAILDGAVATEAQVHAAAAGGAHWPQLGLTENNESPRENDLRGLAPAGAAGVVRNVLQVFDGGIRALGAVNVFGTGMNASTMRRVNGDPTSPFYVRLAG